MHGVHMHACMAACRCDMETKPGHMACAEGELVQEEREAVEATISDPNDCRCPDSRLRNG